MKYLLFTAVLCLLAPTAHAAPRLCPGNIMNVFMGRSFNYCPATGRAARGQAAPRRRVGEWTTQSCARAGGVLDESTGSCTQY